jgi:phenylacetic acid degradation operon negative regulatory protein
VTATDIGDLRARDRAAHASARSLLFTILGEYVHADGAPVWTATLLHVLRLAGYSPQASRQAISRAAAAGWLIGERAGRETRWRLTDDLRGKFDEGPARVNALSEHARAWDGRWLVLVVSIPHERRRARKRLYAGLRWAGLGNPLAGVWLTPHAARLAEVRQLIAELELGDCTVSVTGPAATIGLAEADVVGRAWDLSEVAASYEELLARFDAYRPVEGDEVLLAKLELAGAVRHFPFVDPQLPEALAPGWIGRRAMTRLTELADEWRPAAHAQWHTIVAQTSP